MKRIYIFGLMFIISTSVCGQKLNKALKPFQFLIGKWEMDISKGKFIEEWSYYNNQTLKGKSYRIRNADTTFLEEIRIKGNKDSVAYIPVAFGQNNNKETSFLLISASNDQFIFENKEHDFPQRIVYKKKSDNELLAWIEGNNSGKYQKREFSYRRVQSE